MGRSEQENPADPGSMCWQSHCIQISRLPMFTPGLFPKWFRPLLGASLLLGLAACESSAPPAPAPAPQADSGPLQRTVNRLVAELREDPENETSAAGLIGLREDGLPGSRRLLHDENPEVRLVGVGIVKEILVPASLDTLTASLNDPDEDVRLAVVEALGEWANSRATPALLERYPKEDYPQVRYEILTSLGLIGDDSALPVLRDGLTDEDRYVRMWAMDALCEMKTPDARPRAIELLRDPEVYVRQQTLLSCRKLLRHPSAAESIVLISLEAEKFEELTRARDILRDALKGPDGDRHKAVLIKLAVPALATDRSAYAALLLAEVDDPRAVPALIAATGRPHLMLRHNAAYQLGRLGDPLAVAALSDLLNDNSDLVAATAYDALLRFADAGNESAQKAAASYSGQKFNRRLVDLEDE
jgi:HEAT repeat protein